MNHPIPESATSFPDLLRERARSHPERIACIFLSDDHSTRVSVTYGEIDSEARKVAAILQKEFQPGDRAILLFPPGPGFYSAFLGCLYSGVIPVPAYPPNRPGQTNHATFQRFLAILRDAGPVAILCTRQILGRLEPVTKEFPDARELRWVATDEIDNAAADEWRVYVPPRDAVAFLQYTSGSTALPRGVMVSHANLMANESMMKFAFDHGPECVMVSWLPFYHDMGLIGNFLQVLYVGGLTVLMPPYRFLQNPLRWLAGVTEFRATILAAPNFAYKFCADKISEEEKGKLDLSSVRISVVSAEPIHAATMEHFSDAFQVCGFRREAFFPAYGLAEATLMSTGSPRASWPVIRTFDRSELEAHRAREIVSAPATGSGSSGETRRLVSSGQALPDMEIRIVDPLTRRAVAPQTVGEIWMRGPSITEGYWRREAESAEIFGARIEDEGSATYLRTGDFGFFYEGDLFVTGRLKDLIIIHGVNLYPQDIEQAVEAAHEFLLPGAGAAFALDLPEGEGLAVVHEVDRRVRVEQTGEILSAVRSLLNVQFNIAPSAVVLIRVGTLPKTSSGKIRRGACREMYLGGGLQIIAEWNQRGEAGPATAAPAGAPQASKPDARELSFWIRERIAAHLRCDPTTLDFERPFADIGMDSVGAAQLMGDLETRLGASLSETLPFEFGNIAALARAVLNIAVPESASATPGGAPPQTSETDELVRILAQLDQAPADEASAAREMLRNRPERS